MERNEETEIKYFLGEKVRRSRKGSERQVIPKAVICTVLDLENGRSGLEFIFNKDLLFCCVSRLGAGGTLSVSGEFNKYTEQIYRRICAMKTFMVKNVRLRVQVVRLKKKYAIIFKNTKVYNSDIVKIFY